VPQHALQVDVLSLPAGQHHGRGDVAKQTKQAEAKNPEAIDLGWIAEAANRGIGNRDRDDDEEQPIDQRRQDLRALIAKGHPPGGRPSGERSGKERQTNRANIRKQVTGVGENRERPSEQTANGLGSQHRNIDPKRNPHPPPAVAAPRFQPVRVSVRVHARSLESHRRTLLRNSREAA